MITAQFRNAQEQYELQREMLKEAQMGNFIAVQEAIMNGAPADGIDCNGHNYLHIWATINSMSYLVQPGHVVLCLTYAGADLEAETPLSRQTPLLRCIEGTNSNRALALLQAGANPNAQDVHEESALHYAVAKSRPALVEQLLLAGADPSARARNGFTPAQLCARDAFATDWQNRENWFADLQKKHAIVPELFAESARQDEWLDYFREPEHTYCSKAAWDALPEIFANLRRLGHPVSLADVFKKRDGGASLWESAANQLQTGRLIRALNKEGVQIGTRELIGDDGKPNAECWAVSHALQLDKVFAEENWHGKHPRELRQLYDASEFSQRIQAPNMHQLSTAMTKEIRSMAR